MGPPPPILISTIHQKKQEMTSAEKGTVGPVDQGDGLGRSLQEPTPKITGPAQPAGPAEHSHHPPIVQSQDPPAYQPYEEGDPASVARRASFEAKDSDVEYVGATSEYDSDSDTELLLQGTAAGTWAQTTGPGNDHLVRHSSDEYEDEDEELGEEDEEGDDDGVDFEEDDDDDLSDYTTGMEEMQEMDTRTGGYHRALQHGPYPKSRQQVEQLRKRRPGAIRNRQPRLRTVSGTGLRLDTAVGPSAYGPAPSGEGLSNQDVFIQACDALTARLLQGNDVFQDCH